MSEISCKRFLDRRLYIDGIESYEVSPTRPIKIAISGIINPNRGTLSQNDGISIGISKIGDPAFIDYS